MTDVEDMRRPEERAHEDDDIADIEHHRSVNRKQVKPDDREQGTEPVPKLHALMQQKMGSNRHEHDIESRDERCLASRRVDHGDLLQRRSQKHDTARTDADAPARLVFARRLARSPFLPRCIPESREEQSAEQKAR